jgi:cytochrome b-561
MILINVHFMSTNVLICVAGDMDAAPQNLEGFTTTFGVAQGIGILTAILVTVWADHYRGGFAWRSDVDLEFNWHPVLMTFGMIFLYANCKS